MQHPPHTPAAPFYCSDLNFVDLGVSDFFFLYRWVGGKGFMVSLLLFEFGLFGIGGWSCYEFPFLHLFTAECYHLFLTVPY
jgi:hypothetical protein